MKKFFLAYEETAKSDDGVAEFELHTEEILSIPDGWGVREFEVVTTEQLNWILIEDQYDDYIHTSVRINSEKQYLQEVINAVRCIQGYNTDILFEIIWSVFEGETFEIPEDRVYF